MPTRAAEQLLYDSEATLRLVDNVLDELHQMEADVARSDDQMRLLCTQTQAARAGSAELPEVLLRAHGEIRNVLGSLQQSRGVLERAAEREDPGAETAPADILDGVDRALALVDRTEAAGDRKERADLLAELRRELLGVMGKAHIQDVARQHLVYASSVLLDMETRLHRLATAFEPDQRPA